MNGNSNLIGRQAFNIINMQYQMKGEENWVILFNNLMHSIDNGYYRSKNITNMSDMRKQGIDTDNYLATFRYELTKKLPLSHVT